MIVRASERVSASLGLQQENEIVYVCDVESEKGFARTNLNKRTHLN